MATTPKTIDTTISKLLRTILPFSPSGSHCHDCVYRKIDKCNLLQEYLKVGDSSYSKHNTCYDFVVFYKKNEEDFKSYKKRSTMKL